MVNTETITEQGHRHGTEYADHHWQIWPAHYTEAVEWCAAAEAFWCDDTEGDK